MAALAASVAVVALLVVTAVARARQAVARNRSMPTTKALHLWSTRWGTRQPLLVAVVRVAASRAVARTVASWALLSQQALAASLALALPKAWASPSAVL